MMTRAQFATAYSDGYPRLVNVLVKRRVPEPADVAQDAWLRAWKARSQFEARNDATMLTWVMSIADNVVRDRLRRRAPLERIERFEVPEQSYNPDQTKSLEAEDLRRQLDGVRRRMRPEQWSALVLFHVHGLSCKEVAQVIGADVDTIKTRMFRGRQRAQSRAARLG